MNTLSRIHLNENGEGLCSVPIWRAGLPCGYCNNRAFGVRPDGKLDDYKHIGYVYAPGLACAVHGGPRTRVFKDGLAWCAVHPDFVNLQESIAGFGNTPEEARSELELQGKNNT